MPLEHVIAGLEFGARVPDERWFEGDDASSDVSRLTALSAPLAVQDLVPIIGFKVHVEETYFHCGKALMRSKLWSPAAQVERNSFPTLGRIIAEQTATIEPEVAEKTLEEGYRTRLY